MTSRQTQKSSVLARLQQGPATSWELQQLGICSHTARISDLRKMNYHIAKTREKRLGRWVFIYTLLEPGELFPGSLRFPDENAERSSESLGHD